MTIASVLKNSTGLLQAGVDQPAQDNRQLSVRQRAVGAYLGLAIGDALGATTEFMTPSEIREKHGVHDQLVGGGWLKLKPGSVTDDTEMSLALGMAILENRGVKAEAVGEAFSGWMRSKPVDIGNTVRRGIVHFRNTGKTSVEPNEYDAGNGACMRSLPVALYYWNAPEEMMIRASREQSHITHNNSIADAGTEAMLKMLVSALKGEAKSVLQQQVDELVTRHKIFRHDRRRIENPSGWIVETLQVVFQALLAHDNFTDILIDVVNRGGDADTTGAIAGMLAGALYGVDAIPEKWLKKLQSETGRACQAQAVALVAMASAEYPTHT